MLKSLDYVDSTLAQKIQRLQQQLSKLQQSKRAIENDSSILPKTKEKLLKYQTQCESNTRKLLADERDKLADYLDQQTSVITKNNRESCTARNSYKHSLALNQSTRIDLSTDDSKSIQAVGHPYQCKNVTSFYLKGEGNQQNRQTFRKYGNSSKVTIKRLKKRVVKQQKFIKMLVTWIKIYHQRQTMHEMLRQEEGCDEQSRQLKIRNKELQKKCQQLSNEIAKIRNQYRNTSLNILQTHTKCEQLRQENSGLEMQRKQLMKTAKSLNKMTRKTKSPSFKEPE